MGDPNIDPKYDGPHYTDTPKGGSLILEDPKTHNPYVLFSNVFSI